MRHLNSVNGGLCGIKYTRREIISVQSKLPCERGYTLKKLAIYVSVIVLLLAFGGAAFAAGTSAGTGTGGTTGTMGTTGTTGTTATTSPSPSPGSAVAPYGTGGTGAGYGTAGTANTYGTTGAGGNYGTTGYNMNTYRTRATDNRMDWGWLGLLGLFGLAGMRNRNRNDAENQNRA
jgi:MYXO-CTERM domain-containing protein